MVNFLKDNIATILISLVLLGIVLLIVRGIFKDKKKGKSSCGCNCGSCAMAGSCHSGSAKKDT